MMPIAVMRLRRAVSGGTGTVSFRDAGTVVINGSGTTVAPAVPLGALAGDLLVAAIMRRSAVASDPPAGWTLVSTAGPALATGVTSQYTHVYTKTATGLEAGGTVTFTQASSGRIIGLIIAISATTGTPTVESEANTFISNDTINKIAFSSITSSGNNRLGVLVGSFAAVSPTPTATTLSVPTWTDRGVGILGVDQNRMSIFTKTMAASDNTTALMTGSFAPSAGNGATANSLIFAAP